jgi:aminoglycoside/choline kinase family phosphotransferase
VPDSAQEATNDWAQQAVRGCWPGAWLERLSALKGDASMRRFWRAFIGHESDSAAPASAIVVDLGPDDLPLYARVLDLVPGPLMEPPFVNVHRLMERIGVAVPALYLAAVEQRKLLVEDVGDLSLHEAVKAEPGQASELYRLAVDELVKLHLNGTSSPDRGCMAFSIAYDRRLFRWEMEQFVEYGIPAVAPAADPGALSPELDRVAEDLGALPRVLSHRDYHYQNLFIQRRERGPRIRVIDFQDALMAPAAQDLAVLLTTRDTGTLIPPALEAELVDYYHNESARRGAAMLDRARFLRSYRWCVLQHALKVIGRFVYLEQSGKPGYSAFLPSTLAQARRMLQSSDDFPLLREALSNV